MAFVTMLLPSCLLAMAGATVIGDMDQGAAFTQCVTISDFESKTLSDDITLQDRDDNGCCPAGTVPGHKFYSSYQNAQIVCGFEDDGTIALTSSTSNGVTTCTYNSCYVMKQDITCEDDSKQFLNGCCEGTSATASGGAGTQGFPGGTTGCDNYYYSTTNVHGESYSYCLTYATNYGAEGYEGTASAADDQEDDVLQVDNIYTYAACSGSLVGDSSTPGSTGASAATAAAAPALLAALAVGAQLA